ncbi:MAG TPA: UDP-N-acetylmuramate--L-alanine ligase [Gemmatimonadota bacterium]|nr:UDP-N-acetylmuramate--L-alanine ligase [Gemmatimonadota bacterium]
MSAGRSPDRGAPGVERALLATPRRLHLMGIGGAGMSGLAEWLLDRGHEVGGCDTRASEATRRLERLGARMREGHSPAHLEGADALIVSSAIPADHPERRAALERGIPVIRRAELLGAIMRGSRGIAVAGTHGKSTTTTMTGSVLESGGLDPTVIVGGRIRGRDGNVRIGAGPWVVAEADEFDRSFLALDPEIAVVTNVEADHLDIYGTLEAVRQAFSDFAARIGDGGTLIAGVDDAGARGVRAPEGVGLLGFGTSAEADVRAEEIAPSPTGIAFDLILGGAGAGRVRLAMPGVHNVRNALAAAAVGWKLDLTADAIRAGLEAVRGVERRFEIVYGTDDLMIVDDYAHHPSEIAATLSGAREAWPERRIVAVFQPHLYSRTRDFAGEFGTALAGADLVFVTDVYAAREDPIEGVSGRLISEAAREARAAVRYLPDETASGRDAAEVVDEALEPGDMVVTLGAGDIDELARRLAARRRPERQ